jgi:hypothetical protein
VTRILRKAQGKFSETAIDDEIVVMNLESGDFFSLTGTARDIWLLIDGRLGREELLASLAASYAVPGEAIAGDVEAFLNELDQAGLLERT